MLDTDCISMSSNSINPNNFEMQQPNQNSILKSSCLLDDKYSKKRKRQHVSHIRRTFEAISDYCKIHPYIQLLTEQTASTTDKATLERLRLKLELFQIILHEQKKNLCIHYEQLIYRQVHHQSHKLNYFEKTLDLNDEKEMQYWNSVVAARHEALSFKLESPYNFLLAVFHLFNSTQKFTQAVNQYRSYRKQRDHHKQLIPSQVKATPIKIDTASVNPQNSDIPRITTLSPPAHSELSKTDQLPNTGDHQQFQQQTALDTQKQSESIDQSNSDQALHLSYHSSDDHSVAISQKVEPESSFSSVMATYLMYPIPIVQNDETNLAQCHKRRRAPLYANDENDISTSVNSPEAKVRNSLCRLFQQLDDQLTNVASTIAEDPDTIPRAEVLSSAADYQKTFLDLDNNDTESLGEKENLHRPKRKGRKAKSKQGMHNKACPKTRTSASSSADEFVIKQALSYANSDYHEESRLLPSSAVARQVTGVPILLENFLLSKDYDLVTTGIPFNLPTSQTTGSRSNSTETETTTSSTTFSDSASSFEDHASITFGTRKGRGPLMPEVSEMSLPCPSSTDSAIIHHVYDCLSKSSGIFTMKSKIYQTRLKAYLPEPTTDTQQRYILSISRPPLIPTNTAETQMIEQLRALDDSTAPHKKIQNSGYRVADLLEDFLTSVVNKMMFLLVVEHHTWYIHAPAREQLTKHLLQYIWPARPIIQDNFRTYFLNFVEVRIRHFRDSVARHFREKAKHKEVSEPISQTAIRSTRLRSQLVDKRRSVETVIEGH